MKAAEVKKKKQAAAARLEVKIVMSAAELKEMRQKQRQQFGNGVPTVVTGEWTANKLVHIHHDEHLKTGSTTKGSFFHGDNPAAAIETISNMTFDQIRAEVKEAEAIGMMLDESQDISKKEMLTIVAKLVTNGKAKIRLLRRKHIVDLTVQVIFKEFLRAIKDYVIMEKQLEALNTDGTNAQCAQPRSLLPN